MDDSDSSAAPAEATFGAGCFWKPEAEFARLDGVLATEVGYAGGDAPEPSYEEVCSGGTGHAEVVRVEYDPERVSYRDLLDTFFRIHDPTQLGRQGPDVGSQYRSVVFTHTPEQEREARRAIDEMEASGRLSRPVATEVQPAGPFYRAEEHHQRFLEKRGRVRG